MAKSKTVSIPKNTARRELHRNVDPHLFRIGNENILLEPNGFETCLDFDSSRHRHAWWAEFEFNGKTYYGDVNIEVI